MIMRPPHRPYQLHKNDNNNDNEFKINQNKENLDILKYWKALVR